MKIEKIIFYEEIVNGESVKKSLVFYENGQIASGTYDQGIKAIKRYADENNCSSMNELKKEMQKNIVVLSKKQFQENITDMINKHKEKYESNQENKTETNKQQENNSLNKDTENSQEDEADNSDEYEEVVKETTKSKIMKKVKKLTLFAGIALLGVFGIKSCKNNLEQKEAKIIDNNKDNENNELNDSIDNYTSIEEALSKGNMNSSKKKVVSGIWGYLNHYNSSYSKLHTEKSTNTKLAHKWDEAVANYLAYNSVSKDELTKIFDTTIIDANSLLKAYTSANKQDVLAHTVQTTELGKDKLIKSNKGQLFYQKYEKMVILFNSTKSHDKINKAEEFYKELHKDFDFEKEDIANYKLSIMPMVKAMNKMCKDINLTNKLTEQEKEYINELYSADYISDKFNDYEKTLSTYSMATTAVNEQNNEISYIDLKKLGIKELKELDAYNVSIEDRDIPNHKEYKDSNNIKITNNSNDSKNNDSSKDVSNKSETKKKDSSSKKKTKKTKATIESKIENDPIIVDDTNDDDYTIDIDIPSITTGPAITIIDDGMDHSDDSNDNTNETTDNDIKIDDNYVDENGNLDSSVTDVTTDKTDVTTDALPDPNETPQATPNVTATPDTSSNESVATEIVEDMATNPTLTEEPVKILTK